MAETPSGDSAAVILTLGPDAQQTLRQRPNATAPQEGATPSHASGHSLNGRDEEEAVVYDARLAYLRAILSYQKYVWWCQVVLMSVVGAGIVLFVFFHESPDTLAIRKMLFAYIFSPFYIVLYVLVWLTQAHYEINDVLMRAALFLIGFATCFLMLSMVNASALMLEMN